MDARRARAEELMARFADRTGLTSSRPPRRYLWTDAFAVCNFLGLGQPELALRLVEQVHATLGRHRGDDGRSGWLSGLADEEGAAHPTRGGLRIGKPLPERGAGERSDPELEWEQDGQYFHYLTRWMHALGQVARATGRDAFRAWARELASTAHDRFVYVPRAGVRRMYWKMSIDLSRPLVASMGQHDPLDGMLTCLALGLEREAGDFAAMIDQHALATGDPLGIGGLFTDALRAERLGLLRLAAVLVDAAEAGLAHYHPGGDASRRLAFRELGLAIGLGAAERLRGGPRPGHSTLRATIETFWLEPAHRATATYREHQDIDDVMLATALAPDGLLAP